MIRKTNVLLKTKFPCRQFLQNKHLQQHHPVRTKGHPSFVKWKQLESFSYLSKHCQLSHTGQLIRYTLPGWTLFFPLRIPIILCGIDSTGFIFSLTSAAVFLLLFICFQIWVQKWSTWTFWFEKLELLLLFFTFKPLWISSSDSDFSCLENCHTLDIFFSSDHSLLEIRSAVSETQRPTCQIQSSKLFYRTSSWQDVHNKVASLGSR